MDLSLNEYILILLLMGAVYFDLTRRRIPNYLTIPAMVWGLLSYAVDSGWTGLWESLLGLLAGIGIFVIPFLLGGMGGGDVKLMGAIGALTGLRFLVAAAILSVIFGGAMAVAVLLARGRFPALVAKGLRTIALLTARYLSVSLGRRLDELAEKKSGSGEKEGRAGPVYMPYAVSIALGTLVALFNPGGYMDPLLNLF